MRAARFCWIRPELIEPAKDEQAKDEQTDKQTDKPSLF
jgi:hypothetical protein